MFEVRVLIACVAAITFYVVIPWLYGRWLRRRLAKRVQANRAVVLTFDDGPGDRLTPKVLGVLAEYKAKGSFFFSGRNVKGREELVRRIAEEGHHVCSHGFAHLHAWKVWPWESIRDIKRGWQAIDLALGVRRGVYPFRPPYGKLNLATLLYLWWNRVPVIFWTCDIGDTWPQEKKERQLDQAWAKLRRGAVVLAHDFDRRTDTMDVYVLDTLRRCTTIARESGLRVCSLPELDSATR